MQRVRSWSRVYAVFGLTLLISPILSQTYAASALGVTQRPRVKLARQSDKPSPSFNEADNEPDRLIERSQQLIRQKQPKKAIELLRQALRRYRVKNDKLSEAKLIKHLGNLQLGLRRYRRAIVLYGRMLKLARELKNADVEVQALNNLGVAYRRQRQPEKAIAAYLQGLKLIPRANNPALERQILVNLSLSYRQANDLVNAIDYAKQALEKSVAARDQRNQLEARFVLAAIYSDLGPPAQVIKYGEPGLSLAKQLQKPGREARISLILAAAYSSAGQHEKAVATVGRGVVLADQLDAKARSSALIIVAAVYLRAQQDQQAVEALQSLILLGKRKNQTLSPAAARQQAEVFVASLRKSLQKSQQTSRKPTGQTSPSAGKPPVNTVVGAANPPLRIAQPQFQRGDMHGVIKTLSSWLQRHRGDNQPASVLAQRGQAYLMLVKANIWLGQDRRAIEFADKTVELAKRRSNQELVGLGLALKGIALENLGKPGAVKLAQQVSAIANATKSNEVAAWGQYVFSLATSNQQSIKLAIQSRDLARKSQNAVLESFANLKLAVAYGQVNDYDDAKKSAQAGLAIARRLKNRMLVGYAHAVQAVVLGTENKNYNAAAKAAAKAIAIAAELKNDNIRLYAVLGLGIGSVKQGKQRSAIARLEEAVKIAQAQQNLEAEDTALTLLTEAYAKFKNYPKTITTAQRLVEIAQSRGRQDQAAIGLARLGAAYAKNNQLPRANQTLRRAEVIAQKLMNQAVKFEALARISQAYELGKNPAKAEMLQQQILTIARQEKNVDYMSQAIQLAALTKLRQTGDFKDIDGLLEDYFKLVKQTDAYEHDQLIQAIGIKTLMLEDYQRSEAVLREYVDYAQRKGNRLRELGGLSVLSLLYWYTEQPKQAQQIMSRDLPKFLASQKPEEKVYNAFIAFVNFHTTGQYQKSVEAFEQMLEEFPKTITDDSSNPLLGPILMEVLRLFAAPTYAKANQTQQAIAIFENSLAQLDKWDPFLRAFAPNLDDKAFNSGKSVIFTYMAEVKRQAGDYAQAIRLYQTALALPQSNDAAMNSMNFRVISYVGLAQSYEQQNLPIAATAYYKKAVNQLEKRRQTIDKDLLKSIQEQASFTVAAKSNLQVFAQRFFLKSFTGDLEGRKNSDIYRQLADLLISQNRLAEAQRVLELLKRQELRQFTRSEASLGSQEVKLLDLEKAILEKHGTVIAFGQKLATCKPKQSDCKALRDQLDQITLAFNSQVSRFQQELRQRIAKDPAFLTSDQLSGVASDIINAQPGTALIYPLILKDKIRILLAVKAGKRGIIFRTFEQPNVGQQQLWKKVSRLRELLQVPDSNLEELQATSAQLYDWLIRPLQAELKTGKIKNLVFSLDRATRYIPIATLYDKQRQQYLAQQYPVSTILSAELTKMDSKLGKPEDVSILGLGLSKAVPGFSALPAVPAELNAIIRQPNQPKTQGIYQGSALLNDAFDLSSFRDNLEGKQIVHIATHGSFDPDNPANSFLLSGKGDFLTINKLKILSNYMRDVHLVVLSACETAVGGPDESGIEVPGISFYFLQNRAKAVMASLWLVNDTSTALMMQQFYKYLATGMSKAEALQKAQQDLIEGRLTLKQANTLAGTDEARSSTDQLPADSLAHPYYWAPFILIGNSL